MGCFSWKELAEVVDFQSVEATGDAKEEDSHSASDSWHETEEDFEDEDEPKNYIDAGILQPRSGSAGKETSPSVSKGFCMSWDLSEDEEEEEEELEEHFEGERQEALEGTPLKRREAVRVLAEGDLLHVLPKDPEIELLELETQRLRTLQEEVRQRHFPLDQQFLQLEEEEEAAMAEVERRRAAFAEQLEMNDEMNRQIMEERREEYMRQLETETVQLQQLLARSLNLRTVEEKRRKEEERRRAEVEEKQRKEDEERRRLQQIHEHQRKEEEVRRKAAEEERQRREAKKKAEEEAERERQRQLASAAAATAAAAAHAAAVKDGTPNATGKKEQASGGTSSSASHGQPATAREKVAEAAAAAESRRRQILQALEQQIPPLDENDTATKKERKGLERRLVLHVGQIAATKVQVRRKSEDILQMLEAAPHPGVQNFLVLKLADKVLAQCEAQVQKLPSFAFAIAQVLVNVSMKFPIVMDVLIGRLNAECIYTVPKHFTVVQGNRNANGHAAAAAAAGGGQRDIEACEEDELRLLGYRKDDGKWESTDAFVHRMGSYVTFFAAILQTDGVSISQVDNSRRGGLAEAWVWLAQLLNHLPPNHYTATALESFVKVVGFRLHAAYPRPFLRLLQSIMVEFVPRLAALGDADVTPIMHRIHTYISTQTFSRPPEGWNLPDSDASSLIRA